MDMTTNNRKAIEACYFMQPDILTGMIEEGSFDNSLLEDIGGISKNNHITYKKSLIFF